LREIDPDLILKVFNKGPEEFNKAVKPLIKDKSIRYQVKIENETFTKSFKGYTFPFNIQFIDCKFTMKDQFHGMKNACQINFNRCLFHYGLWFNELFIEKIKIEDCILEFLGFHRCKISNSINLTNIEIKENFNITETDFSLHHNFEECLCLKNIKVAERSFMQHLYFHANVKINNCVFNGLFEFFGCYFYKKALFNNNTFLDITNIRITSFERPPNFTGSKLHPLTLFPDIKDIKLGSTLLPDQLQDIQSVRYLKSHAAKVMDRRQQSYFFTLEQNCLIKAGKITGIERILSRLYEIFSNYGTSVKKPFTSLLVFIIFFSLINYIFTIGFVSELFQPIDQTVIKESLLQSLESTFLPFKIILKKELKLTIILFGVLQSIISILLFALIGLALRWNFKRD
jgi:hypothetical protein